MPVEEVTLDWEMLYCPNNRCKNYGENFKIIWLVRNGRSRGEPRTRYQGYGSRVTWNSGTAYYGLGTDPVSSRPPRRHWRRGIRCGPQPGSSKWMRRVEGWLDGPHANAFLDRHGLSGPLRVGT